MSYILSRMSEPSTWAGLAVLLGALGIHLAPEVMAPIVQTLTGLAGVAAIVVKEKSE